MSSDCFGLIEVFWVFLLFDSIWVNIRETQNQKSTSARVFSGWGFIVFWGVLLVLKCNQIVTMSAKRVSFLFLFFFCLHFFVNNSSQAFLATLTDWLTEREIFYFVSWNIMGHFEGTARLFFNVSMVFSLHLITRSQKSTKMDEFELSGCTKLRYLHDWCCLALLSSFIWLFLY